MASTGKLLKKDVFGEVSRLGDGPDARILRDASAAPAWARWLARRLLENEARALAAADGLAGVPELLRHDRDRLERSHLEGRPMQEARPRERAYFRAALALLRRLHRAGIVHNDLAKEPNLLVLEDGQPGFVDFQIAMYFRRRGRVFRQLAREDLRHLLKHKRNYRPDLLTARQRRLLASPSVASRVWMTTGKPVYLFVTRRLLGWADREGAADRGRAGP